MAGLDRRVRQLRRRLQRDPRSTCFVELSTLLLELGQLDEALAACLAGRTFHPQRISARVLEGRILQALGRKDEAVTVFEGVVEEQADRAGVWRMLASLHRSLGNEARAAECEQRMASKTVDKPLQLDPRFCTEAMAKVFRQQGKVKEAQAIERALGKGEDG